MPTVLRIGPYKFYFYSHEPNEPPHVHVDRGNLSAKFWLHTGQLARNVGFSPHELNKLGELVKDHKDDLLEKWYGHFGIDG